MERELAQKDQERQAAMLEAQRARHDHNVLAHASSREEDTDQVIGLAEEAMATMEKFLLQHQGMYAALYESIVELAEQEELWRSQLSRLHEEAMWKEQDLSVLQDQHDRLVEQLKEAVREGMRPASNDNRDGGNQLLSDEMLHKTEGEEKLRHEVASLQNELEKHKRMLAAERDDLLDKVRWSLDICMLLLSILMEH